jgi:hypothetical protein
LRRAFVEQGSFLFLPQFLPPEATARLVSAVTAVQPSVNRNYLPGHKQGGSVGRYVIDESSSRLDYELHTREKGVAVVPGSIQIPPGGLVFFDGDALRHRITPLGEGEIRVSLTLEYVTDPRIRRGWRLISNMKDALGYFGFRQVFRRRSRGAS